MSVNPHPQDGPPWTLPAVARGRGALGVQISTALGVAGLSSTDRPGVVDKRGVPTMEVASSFSSRPVLLGLDGPLNLLGGDRLGPTGIVFELAMHWQPNLMRAVGYACDEQRLRGCDWFTMPPVVLCGPRGAGRSHVSRRIAAAAGVPYLEIDANDADCTHHHSWPNVEMPSPLFVGMALTRCANPIVSVANLETSSPDRIERICAMIDPSRNRQFVDEALGATLDLSAVTWLIEGTSADMLPERLRHVVGWIDLKEPAGDAVGDLVIDIIAEAMADLDLPRPSSGDILRMTDHFQRRPDRRSACEIYRHVVLELGPEDDDPPF